MDLSTRYMGFDLPHPLMPGASPLVDDLDKVRRMEDAGASAIVMHSLFEEQIVAEQMFTHHHYEEIGEQFAEARSYLPDPGLFALGPEQYLEQIRKIKAAVGVPVIASLNGTTRGGWLKYARLIEEAGADGLELNLYVLTSDPELSAEAIEDRTLGVVREVKANVKIPLAVKLSPFYTGLTHFARRLDAAEVDALVIFNRFYQPDIDPEALTVDRALRLSSSDELPLRLRWLGIFSGRINASLAVTGGVHTAVDAIKAVMAGAHGVQVVSALLQFGPEYLAEMRRGMIAWMEEHEYDSLTQMQGSMSLLRCPDPEAYERGNYMKMLQSWTG